MKRGRLAPLVPAARRAVLAAIRVKDTLQAGLAAAVRAPLGVLPIAVQARLRHSFRPVAALDYRRHRILLHVDSAHALYRTAACRKEPETVQWIEEYIRPGDVLYDVGANVGAYSLIAAKHCGGNVSVLAFEPSFATYDELCRNVVLNGCEQCVIPLLVCLTEAPGLVNFGHSSLEPGSALHVSDPAAAAGAAIVYRQQLLGLSIDQLIAEFGCPAPHHLKIDVDGAELAILRGAASTFAAGTIRTIQVEVSPQDASAAEVESWLAARGFRMVVRTARGGGSRWSNWLFVRS